MNFEFIATYVELQDIPSYSTNITVEGQLLKLSFLWNERIGKRVLSIKNSADVVYLQNTILHPNEPLELNSNAVLDDLPYSVTLVKTGDVNKVGNIFNWSKDFILCFSRTVDLDVKRLNVVYGVTKPSTPTIPPIVRPDLPPPPYGDWILNQGYEIVGNDIKYTAYKTNSLDYYDSFALADLTQTLVESFHDSDLQQYAAFTTAVEQLIGAVDWVLDLDNNQIRYTENADLIYFISVSSPGWDSEVKFASIPQACSAYVSTYNANISATLTLVSTTNNACIVNQYNSNGDLILSNYPIPVSQVEEEQKTLPLDVVAQKVIYNAESSEDEVLKLLSDDYINLVAESIFNTDTSKQFVKLEDLIPQLEDNKALRS